MNVNHSGEPDDNGIARTNESYTVEADGVIDALQKIGVDAHNPAGVTASVLTEPDASGSRPVPTTRMPNA